MTRINDVVKIVAPYLDDRHGEPEAKALHMIHALDDDGHLLPDLPEHDEIAHPGPTKVWDVGEYNFVEYDPIRGAISISQSFGPEVRLNPDDIPAAVSALLAAHSFGYTVLRRESDTDEWKET